MIAACALPLMGLAGAALARESRSEPRVSWTVRLDVHWGEHRNREAYRHEFEQELTRALLEKACFASVADPNKPSDLVLEVQLNDFLTEQEYDSAETIFPGQGEQHTLRSARARVDLDYRLRPAGGGGSRDILDGHFYREAARVPQSPTDTAEARALKDLTVDASRWVVREVCDRREKLASRIREAMPPPAAGVPGSP